MFILSAISRILILLLFCTVNDSVAQVNNPNSSCPSSSCGNIRTISYPFRLRGDSSSCGYNHPIFELDCQNNQTIFTVGSRNYNVQEINYDGFSIRLVDPGINRVNSSSCPVYYTDFDDWPGGIFERFSEWNVDVMFIHCITPVASLNYVSASFCGNRSTILSEIYSYVMVGEQITILDLEDSCAVDGLKWAAQRPMMDNFSLAGIYDSLGYGFVFSWFRVLCGECYTNHGYCNVTGNTITCTHHCYDAPPSQLGFRCQFEVWFETWGPIIGMYSARGVSVLLTLKFLCGFPFLVGLVVYKWRRRHLSIDETIEEFLQNQNTLTPIQYTFSEIKKMTNNFNQILGEGGYGTVYKGKLRSSPYVAVKLMRQSLANKEEFISEVATIGLINHVNVVQLVGFCVEPSKCALVYEFLPNGSLDRYIFGEHVIGGFVLRYEKMFEIALGVARGIDYLHHGCDMQILHFDIKPHNILLDESFNPKISDFGLAKLYPVDGSTVNVTAARGTMGYMAPEMFYKNIGGVSYKADVYSFGMLLMEMAGRGKNMNPFDDDMCQVYFPSWIYDQLNAGKDLEIKDAADNERKVLKKIVLVALWCIQMKPSDRPSMTKVVEMLEGDSELQMPPKPFLALREIAEYR